MLLFQNRQTQKLSSCLIMGVWYANITYLWMHGTERHCIAIVSDTLDRAGGFSSPKDRGDPPGRKNLSWHRLSSISLLTARNLTSNKLLFIEDVLRSKLPQITTAAARCAGDTWKITPVADSAGVYEVEDSPLDRAESSTKVWSDKWDIPTWIVSSMLKVLLQYIMISGRMRGLQGE
jgi:hypothetical protein